MFTEELVQGCVDDWRSISVHPEPCFPPSVYYRVLYLLVQRAAPEIAVELGTCGGGASLHMAMGCSTTKVYTFDNIKEWQVSIAETLVENFHFILDDSVQAATRFQDASVGLLFVDTTHTYEQTMAEYRVWLPKMRSSGIVIFDDIGRGGMDRAIAEIGGHQLHYPWLGGDGGMVFLLLGG